MSAPANALAVHRFGYGARAGLVPGHAPADLLAGPDTMATLFPIRNPDTALAIAMERRRAEREANALPDDEKKPLRQAIQAAARDDAEHNMRSDLARAVEAQDYYRERLVRFWADHFTVGWKVRVDRPVVAAFIETAIRPYIARPFGEMLRAAVTHPMMLRWLDQVRSTGPQSKAGEGGRRGVNENLGRELLELHTLGAGAAYSQTDVRQTALLLTGLTIDAKGETAFNRNRAEPGAEVVLGKSYGGAKPALSDIHDLLEDLALHPATARHIAGKLAVHFVSDTPGPGLPRDLEAVYLDTGGDLLAISRALIAHPAAADPQLHKARQPFDFIVAGLRALDVGADQIFAWNRRRLQQIVQNPLLAMGQPWQAPGGPDGWEEGFERWITPQALAARVDWAMQVPALVRRPLPEARAFARSLLPGFDTKALEALVARAETNSEGLGLCLAAPLFNRR